MANNTRTTRSPRVIGALVLAGVLIGCAYVISGPSIPFLTPKTASAADTQQLLKEYAQKDSDNDGLPDWQEALYGTDPNNAHSVSQTLTDGEAVAQGLIKPKFQSQAAATASTTQNEVESAPGIAVQSDTLTAQFAQSLLTNYLAATTNTNSDLTSDQVDSLVQQSLTNFVSTHQRTAPYTTNNESISGSGVDALRTYAASAENAITTNTVDLPKGELDYLSDAVEKNDTSALSNLALIGKEYTGMSKSLLTVTVPTEAAAAHLEILNATALLGQDITDMSMMQKDPLRAYVGLAEYQNDAPLLAKAFSDMGQVFNNSGIEIIKGQPGSHFYSTCVFKPGQ